MEFNIQSILGFIRANFFYDLRSSVITLCLIFGVFFLFKLLKDNGEKVNKSLKYLTYSCLSFGILILIF